MRLRPLLAFSLLALAAEAQPHCAPRSHPSGFTSQPSPISLTPDQQSAIRSMLRTQHATWECNAGGRDAKWVDDLHFEKLFLRPGMLTILAQADSGCTRAGLGTNGAMWIVSLGSGAPKIIASPAHDFNGYLQTVDSTISHGYRDLTIGWNLSPTEDGLTYLHFDGNVYRAVGKATLYSGDPEHGSKLVPEHPARRNR